MSLDYFTPKVIGTCCEIGRCRRSGDVKRRLGYVRSEQSEHCTILEELDGLKTSGAAIDMGVYN